MPHVPIGIPLDARTSWHAMKRDIGLLRELTNGNLGNAAFEAAAVQHVADYFPKARIYVTCIDSLETLKSYGVRLFPINPEAERLALAQRTPPQNVSDNNPAPPRRRKTPFLAAAFRRRAPAAVQNLTRFVEEIRFWIRSYRLLKGFKMLILCGGGQLGDLWGGPWGHPYRLFMWAVLARLSRTRFIVLNVAVEQVLSPLSLWFLRRALRTASYISFRDEKSQETVARWDGIGRSYVHPDLAFSLRTPDLPQAITARPLRHVVGISPMPYGDPRFWPHKDERAYQKYLTTLAAFTHGLLVRGYNIELLVSQVRMDVTAMRDLRELIVQDDPKLKSRIVEPEINTVNDFLLATRNLDFVVASRMHGLLLSQMSYTPTLAISYDSKVDSLMAVLGLADYCLDIRKIDLAILNERFSALEAKRAFVADQLERSVTAFRKTLEDQYDAVFHT
jgi:polysaccharide pyruvyl transferase WcaK-like protein